MCLLENWDSLATNVSDLSELINTTYLYTKRHPVTMRLRIGGVYTKVIADTGASLTVINTGFLAALNKNYLSEIKPYEGVRY